MESAIGPSMAMEAVEDITLLMITLRMVKITSSLNMLILPPIQPITVSAISLPAPLSEIPAAKPSEPARTHTVVQSRRANTCLTEMQPVRIQARPATIATAPTVQIPTTKPITVRIRMAEAMIIFTVLYWV
jgi:hypothetical protein